MSTSAKSEEFRIDIAGDEITAKYYPVQGGERVVGNPAALPADDSLPMRTAMLLDSWLNLWDQINVRRAENRQLIVSDKALEIIGQHLWNLILANSIGEGLQQLVQRRIVQLKQHKADRKRSPDPPPLRVVITFKDGSGEKNASYDKLKALPWEFLWMDSPGLFLATEATLQLVRCVDSIGPDPHTAPPPSGESMRVQFVTLFLSTRDGGYAHISEEVRTFREKVNGIVGVNAAEPWLSMSSDAIAESLKDLTDPPHVIHLVGLCKGQPGKPRVYLPDGEGAASWQDPDSLIEALTPVEVDPPRLVILHLCEEEAGDASENFERMAPALIARGVPAVLALQYPMEVAPDLEIGTSFYQRLAAGVLVGTAVQASRAAMRKGASRNFGTPVLYLPNDLVIFKRKEGGGDRTIESPEHDPNAPDSILQRLGQALWNASSSELDAEAGRTVLKRLRDWVVEADALPRAALVLMRSQYPDPAERRAVEFFLEQLEAPSKGGRSGRTQARTRPPARQFVNTR